MEIDRTERLVHKFAAINIASESESKPETVRSILRSHLEALLAEASNGDPMLRADFERQVEAETLNIRGEMEKSKARKMSDHEDEKRKMVGFLDDGTPCGIFRSCSRYVGEWRDKQPRLKEESITDWLLYEISRRTKRVKYHDFTRFKEGRTTGADWEWWILVGPKGGYRFRVQAKRLFHRSDNYPSLAYASGEPLKLQIERLIKDSEVEHAMPLYAFYCESTDPTLSRCHAWKEKTGVYIVSAREANRSFVDTTRRTVNAADILGKSIPLQCFACCSVWSSSKDPNIFISLIGGDATDPAEASHYHEYLPSYVTALTERETEREEFEGLYSGELPNVKAVVVCDWRDLKDQEKASMVDHQDPR